MGHIPQQTPPTNNIATTTNPSHMETLIAGLLLLEFINILWSYGASVRKSFPQLPLDVHINRFRSVKKSPLKHVMPERASSIQIAKYRLVGNTAASLDNLIPRRLGFPKPLLAKSSALILLLARRLSLHFVTLKLRRLSPPTVTW